MPSTPSSGYTPLPSRPRPLFVRRRAAGAQYSVVTHSNNPPNRRTVNGRLCGDRSFRGACSIIFFGNPGRTRSPSWPEPTPRPRLDLPGLEKLDESELPDQRTSQVEPATGPPTVPADPATAAVLAAARRQHFSRPAHTFLAHELPCATCHPWGPSWLLPAQGLIYPQRLPVALFRNRPWDTPHRHNGSREGTRGPKMLDKRIRRSSTPILGTFFAAPAIILGGCHGRHA